MSYYGANKASIGVCRFRSKCIDVGAKQVGESLWDVNGAKHSENPAFNVKHLIVTKSLLLTTPHIVPFAKIEKMREVILKGKPKDGCRRFTIYFQHDTFDEPPNIELAFDVRFKYGEDTKVVLCNDRLEGEWGVEDRKIRFTFKEKENFSIKIEVYDNSYRIFHNTEELVLFERKHTGAKPVNTIRIANDVEIQSLQII